MADLRRRCHLGLVTRFLTAPYEWLSDEEIAALLGLARHAREVFLIQLLAETGMRIGEALGLRQGGHATGCHIPECWAAGMKGRTSTSGGG
ncbi:hypothetical protein [Nonomuraea sp. NPDC049607]|uniref:hypothetical protein n=1 Tax=Nonomuraea sp. NPDC049607 TaxID=3154732 RepID=UPI0034489050